MKEDVNKKVEEALRSLDALQRAEANPFLYNKIRGRLQQGGEFVPQQLAWRMIAALVVIAILNLFTLSHFGKEDKQHNGSIESVANEYSITLPQTY